MSNKKTQGTENPAFFLVFHDLLLIEFAEFARRLSFFCSKDTVEVRYIIKSAVVADFRNAFCCFNELY